MTTAAAIDRLVRHSVILEMTGASVRAEEAGQRSKQGATTTTTTTKTKQGKQSGKEAGGELSLTRGCS